MWCRHCQQDVPAVAPTSRSNLTCTRCRRELQRARSAAASSAPSQTGIELDSLDPLAARPAAQLPTHDPEERLRRIRRGLRPVFRLDLGIDPGDRQAGLHTAPPVKAPPSVVDPSPSKNAASPLAWALLALLASGVVALGIGFGSLAWATVHANDMVWHWGMTATIAGEAALILGLTAMAIRLWQNSRQLNSQLDGVDQQLAEVQYTAGRLAHARQSCSQAYYDHFGAAASPPIALANLRGQLDQLSARLSR